MENPLPLIFLLFGGGIVLALISLIIASRSSSSATRIFFVVTAILALLAQGGCWIGAIRFGRATGSSGGGGSFGAILFLSAILIVGWIVAIFAKEPDKKDGNEN